MKTLIAIISLFSISCFGQVERCSNNYKYLVYNYKIDNNDSKHIGFNLIEGDESEGVKSIAIYPNSKYIFLVDGSHNNLKRIDISTGEMVSSKKVNELFSDGDQSLIDIAILNHKIYVTSNSYILIYDFDLNYLSNIKVNSKIPNTVRFSKATKDSLYIYLSHKQLQDKSIEKEQLVITDKVNFIKKVRIPINQFIEDGKRLKTLGKDYKVNAVNDKVNLHNEYGCYELKGPIPSNKYYSSRNIDFDDKTIVFFDSTPTQFTLYCYLITSK